MAPHVVNALKIRGLGANYVPYTAADGTVLWLAPGTAGKVLTSNGAGTPPSWETPAGGAGEANTASNEGAGDAEIFITKTGVNLEFRTITGTGGIAVTENGDEVEIDGSGISGSGVVVQVKNIMVGAAATGTTVIPLDDTIPQNTEGDEYMGLAITPTSATNKLRIDVVVFAAVSANQWITVALFQDSTANALAAFANYQTIAGGGNSSVFTHYMTAGTTSATTFKVRVGRDASAGGTVTFNGQGGNRLFGGVIASSITITEIVP